MNQVEIKLSAKRIWNLLSDHNRWSYEKLKQTSGLDEFNLHAALGWLAREDKIIIEETRSSYCCYTGVNVYIG